MLLAQAGNEAGTGRHPAPRGQRSGRPCGAPRCTVTPLECSPLLFAVGLNMVLFTSSVFSCRKCCPPVLMRASLDCTCRSSGSRSPRKGVSAFPAGGGLPVGWRTASAFPVGGGLPVGWRTASAFPAGGGLPVGWRSFHVGQSPVRARDSDAFCA